MSDYKIPQKEKWELGCIALQMHNRRRQEHNTPHVESLWAWHQDCWSRCEFPSGFAMQIHSSGNWGGSQLTVTVLVSACETHSLLLFHLITFAQQHHIAACSPHSPQNQVIPKEQIHLYFTLLACQILLCSPHIASVLLHLLKEPVQQDMLFKEDSLKLSRWDKVKRKVLYPKYN